MHQHVSFLRRGSFVLGVAALAIILAGCLKFPLGNPENAKVDSALVGDWFKRADDGSVTIWNAQPFDSRTYLVMQYQARADGNGGWERGGLIVCKMWLTDIDGSRFACLKVLSEASETPYIAFRYELAGESITVHPINAEFVNKAEVGDSAAFEALVKQNLQNKELFLDVEKYDKASDADRETVEAIRKAFH